MPPSQKKKNSCKENVQYKFCIYILQRRKNKIKIKIKHRTYLLSAAPTTGMAYKTQSPTATPRPRRAPRSTANHCPSTRNVGSIEGPQPGAALYPCAKATCSRAAPFAVQRNTRRGWPRRAGIFSLPSPFWGVHTRGWVVRWCTRLKEEIKKVR